MKEKEKEKERVKWEGNSKTGKIVFNLVLKKKIINNEGKKLSINPGMGTRQLNFFIDWTL